VKTILVTGASGNLGKTLVEYLHGQNYFILAASNPERESGLFNHLPNVQGMRMNVLDAAAVNDRLTGPAALPVQAAVLLVGGFAMGTIQDTDTDLLEKMYRLNFLSAFNVVNPLMPQFERAGGGQFILIGARPGLAPNEGKDAVAYALSKSLLITLAGIINAEGKPNAITATVVVPGILDTPVNRNAMPGANPDHWVPTDKLAELIGFLLSDTGRMTRETVVKFYHKS
jgi:NAD(P)-dependent dehydrogenase (short-subunit alcohol dehydrogenase family)